MRAAKVQIVVLSLVLLLLGVGLVGVWWLHEPEVSPAFEAAPASIEGDPSRGSDRGAAASAATDRRTALVGQAGVRGWLLQDGKPLAAITVIACEGFAWQASELDRAVTDERGEFSLPRVNRRFWLTARGDGVPRFWKTGWRSAARSLGELEVEAPAAIEGTVKQPDGTPIPDAEVAWMVGSHQRVVLDGTERVSCRTDAAGRFRLGGLSSGWLTLYCDSKDYAPVPDHLVEVAAGQTVTSEIVMREGRTLRGLVLDHRGHTLANADVWRQHGTSTKTDSLGQFELPHHAFGNPVRITAPGHLAHKEQWASTKRQLRVQLERAVTLRASVFGTKGLPGSVFVAHCSDPGPDASHRLPAAKLYEWLDIVRDEQFELGGLPMSDFEVTVRVPGVGRVGPVRVEMRDDVDITLAVEPQRQVEICVHDELGDEIEGCVLVRDEGILDYPRTYEKPPAKLMHLIRHSRRKLAPMPLAPGGGMIGVPKGEGLAFLVEAPGHLSVARSVMPDAMPNRIEVVLERSGGLQGRAVGGDREAYATSVQVYAVGEQDANAKPVASAAVAGDGEFSFEKLRPGVYRAVLRRANTANTGEDSVGVPLVDSSEVAASQTQCVVRAGEITTLDLREPELGLLRGRVLLRGAPLPGAVIAASRDATKPPSPALQLAPVPAWGKVGTDWDSELALQYSTSQRTAKDGSFRFLYASAGPLEVRLRHPDGHATSAAIRVVLPAPGADVVRDFDLPIGEIRGRVPLEQLDARLRDGVQVTLFPANKVHHDPFYSADYAIPLLMDCATIKKPADGRFAFSYLRSGTWLVRVHLGSFSNHLLWQKVCGVHADVVDFGDLEMAKTVSAVLSWRWRGKPSGEALGVWLHQKQAGGVPIWVATRSAINGTASCSLVPGAYEVTPIGWPGFHGDGDRHARSYLSGVGGKALADAVAVTVRADGSVEPEQLLFIARPVPANSSQRK